MRLPARRIATTALSAALVLGVTGPAAVAADGDATRDRTHVSSQAPVPEADALLQQVGSVAGLGGVLTPVTQLLDAVLKSDNGQLPDAQATELSTAVKDAIAQATAALPATSPSPTTPDATTPDTTTPDVTAPEATTPDTTTPDGTAPEATTPEATTPDATTPGTTTPGVTVPEASTLPAPALPAVPAVPAAPAGDAKAPAANRAQAPSDLTAEALTALQKAVDAVLKAATGDDVAQVTPAVTEAVNGLVNVIAATLVGSGLPAPTLEGLQAQPTAPDASTTVPSTTVPSTTVPSTTVPSVTVPQLPSTSAPSTVAQPPA
ncbi:hypothetical protein ACFTXK_03695 [Streptomyces sp. NPDC056956]|uniref:hypothetical protein n=1 Tax=unclassified Streptomyces TaxID=2593676 RepID=UPI003627297F